MKLLVTAKEAAQMLSIGVSEVYGLTANGQLDKKYIGTGTRNYRITVESISRYVEGLPSDPIEAA